MSPANIRNFSIIAHIDHGKSTLADRLLETTKTIDPREMRSQFMDQMELEQERGITIKAKTVRMTYQAGSDEYTLNLIDTPGHVDFGYEVSRALFCCEGAILLVDATQGIQAQTISNVQKARDLNLVIIPVINKIDLKNAQIEKTKNDLVNLLNFDEKGILQISAKTGENVDKLLKAVIKKIPDPKHLKDRNFPNTDYQALIFDSFYDEHKGVIILVRVFDGQAKKNNKVKFLASGIETEILELGYLTPFQTPTDNLTTGEVGYIATGFKDPKLCRVGDTVVDARQKNPKPISGYKEPKPVVFASFYPVNNDDYPRLRQSLEKFKLSDSSLEFWPESSPILGQGFKIGFLGLLHVDIVKERLEREFDLDLVVTDPGVEYEITKKGGPTLKISSPKDFPDPSTILETREPWTRVKIITPKKYLGAIMKLCEEKRGKFVDMDFSITQSTKTKQNLPKASNHAPAQYHDGAYSDQNNVFLTYEIPLAEIIIDFADHLKSVSSGFASFDYGAPPSGAESSEVPLSGTKKDQIIDYRKVDLVKLDILVHHEKVEPLSRLVIRDEAQKIGRQLVEKLKELLPRQQFSVAVQAVIGGKIVARADVPVLRKNVLSGIYGGHRERKDKLLERQKRGKKKMKEFGKVSIPKKAFRIMVEK